MIRKILRASLLILIISLVVACGTSATPVFEAPEEGEITDIDAASADDHEEVASVPTATVQPPTSTPTDEPTATTEPPTPTPTDEPTEVASDPIARLIAMRDPADGEVLFNTTYDTNMGPFACETCHYVDQEAKKIGPSLLGIPDTAATREDGVSVERYLYNSIVNPNEYLVEGYPENLMPQNWHDILSDTEIYDIIAYLLTLEG